MGQRLKPLKLAALQLYPCQAAHLVAEVERVPWLPACQIVRYIVKQHWAQLDVSTIKQVAGVYANGCQGCGLCVKQQQQKHVQSLHQTPPDAVEIAGGGLHAAFLQLFSTSAQATSYCCLLPLLQLLPQSVSLSHMVQALLD
jgi:hypothetical protein